MPPTLGYAITIFLIGVIVAGLYMLIYGLPVSAVVWLLLMRGFRRTTLSPRFSAILSGATASFASAVPAGIFFGVGSLSQIIAVTLFFGAVPCVMSILYFLLASRGASWAEIGGERHRRP